jgi:flagellar protein FliS
MASIAFLEPYIRVADAPMDETFRGELVSLLITSALKKIDQAKRAHDEARPVEKGFYLGRATAIIDALRDTLDVEAGGQSARDFDKVYEHIDLCLQVCVQDDSLEGLRQAREAICRLSACWQAAQCKTSLLKGTA